MPLNTPKLLQNEIPEIGKNLHEAWHSTCRGQPGDRNQKENRVARLIVDVVGGFKEDVAPIYEKIGIQAEASGVFIHGQPMVEQCDVSKGVKLGDLLVIVDYEDHTNNQMRMAMMLQSKTKDRFKFEPSKKKQDYLYSQWPTFTYKSGMPTTAEYTTPRVLNGPHLNLATQFLIIPNKAAPHPRCREPKTNMGRSFATTLQGLMSLDTGKEFSLPAGADDFGWNRVIQDLLLETANTTRKAMEQQQSDSKRGVNCFVSGKLTDTARPVCSVTQRYLETVNEGLGILPPPENLRFEGEAPGGGISTLYFRLKQNDPNRIGG